MLGHSPLSANPLSAFGALQSVSITGAGGVLASGAATTKRGRRLTASSGMLASGAATTKRGRAATGSGGVTMGGFGFLTVPLYLQLTVPWEARRLTPPAETRSRTLPYEKRRLTA